MIPDRTLPVPVSIQDPSENLASNLQPELQELGPTVVRPQKRLRKHIVGKKYNLGGKPSPDRSDTSKKFSTLSVETSQSMGSDQGKLPSWARFV